MKKVVLFLLCSFCIFSLALNGVMAGEFDRKGMRLATINCKGCHDLTDKKYNKIGPYLWGIIGRTAGKAKGYKYSRLFLLQTDLDGIVWGAVSVSTYLENPRAFIPGTRMAFGGFPNLEDRKDVVEYLKTLKE